MHLTFASQSRFQPVAKSVATLPRFAADSKKPPAPPESNEPAAPPVAPPAKSGGGLFGGLRRLAEGALGGAGAVIGGAADLAGGAIKEVLKVPGAILDLGKGALKVGKDAGKGVARVGKDAGQVAGDTTIDIIQRLEKSLERGLTQGEKDLTNFVKDMVRYPGGVALMPFLKILAIKNFHPTLLEALMGLIEPPNKSKPPVADVNPEDPKAVDEIINKAEAGLGTEEWKKALDVIKDVIGEDAIEAAKGKQQAKPRSSRRKPASADTPKVTTEEARPDNKADGAKPTKVAAVAKTTRGKKKSPSDIA